jgi:hypothetical protein
LEHEPEVTPEMMFSTKKNQLSRLVRRVRGIKMCVLQARQIQPEIVASISQDPRLIDLIGGKALECGS